MKLHEEGFSTEHICAKVYEEFASAFKAKDSSARTVKRFLRETYGTQNVAKTQKTFEEQVSERREKILSTEAAKKDKKLLTKIAVTEMIVDSIRDVVRERPFRDIKPFNVKIDRNYSEETIVLMISDIQAGTYISKESSGGLNEYNWEILEKQFVQFYKGLEEIVTRHKQVAPIASLHVHLIGDIVEGYDIFKGQTRQIDREITEQAIGVKDLLCDFLIKALYLFEKIHVVAVPGNHGRIGSKGENLHYVSWDYIVYKWMESELKNYDRIIWQVTKSWWQIDKIYNYLELGHFHVPSELSGVTTEKFVNGCWPGGSLYSMKGLVSANYPVQKLFAVHPTQGVTYRYPLRLTLSKKKGSK